MAGNKHVVIDVGEEEEFNQMQFIKSIKSKIMESCEAENFFNRPPTFIPRVRENVRCLNVDYYNPKVVSIGPYHHGKSELQAMEGYKAKCLRDLLERSSTPFEKCFKEMRKEAARARTCYEATFGYSVMELVEIMMVDAGFIIELFIKEMEHGPPLALASAYPLIERDLLLLENQLPFSILQCMFDLTITKSETSPTLHEIALCFFSHGRQRRGSMFRPDTVHHLLHLYQSQFQLDMISVDESLFSSIPGAWKLYVMGVEFERASENGLLADAKFDKENAVMQLPRLFITEETIALFTNLIALEQTHIGFGSHFTSYAVFLSYILSDEADVEFLAGKGIIEHQLASHLEVVQLFRKMCTGMFIDPRVSRFFPILRAIEIYSKSSKAEKIAKVRMVRMGEKPWHYIFYRDKISLALTLLGGVGLWIFTCLQTLYTIIAYYKAS